MLVEFPSVVDAVACAVEIQRGMRGAERRPPEDRRIVFRIGIHLGDIIIEDNDIHGDGVNIAARIESLAKPGGVAVSGSVRDNVGNRLDLAFEDTGEKLRSATALRALSINATMAASSADFSTIGTPPLG